MTETKPTTPDIAAVAKFLTTYLEPRVVEVTPARFGEAETVPVLLLPTGMTAHDYRPLVEAYRGHPDRRRGSAKVEDLESFVAHANRHKDQNSAIFADPTRAEPKLTTIFNYNLRGEEVGFEDAMARFGDHRLIYAPKKSDEFKAWEAVNNEGLDQLSFAEFIEDRITDIIAPPDFDGEESEYNAFLKEFSDLIGGDFASPSRMLELSRGVKINADHRVKQLVNLASGEGQIHFSEEHKDESGAPIKIPNLFLIAIPIFYNGPAYRIPVRLRYRLIGGGIKWAFQIYRIDRAFDAAFDGIRKTAEAQIELPIFLGTPEG